MNTYVSALALLALTTTAALGQACGDLLTTDTTLTGDLQCSGVGLTIAADDIVLDCAGFTLTGDGSNVGILLETVTGATVENCTAEGFAVGFQLTNAAQSTLRSNVATANTAGGSGGFVLSQSNGNVLEDNRAGRNEGRGFLLLSSSENTLMGNLAVANRFRAFGLTNGSSANALINNSALGNRSAAFVLTEQSTGNALINNVAAQSESEGFELQSRGNFLSFNRALSNGTWGFDDNSVFQQNGYQNNYCEGNGAGGSWPVPGTLCSPQP